MRKEIYDVSIRLFCLYYTVCDISVCFEYKVGHVLFVCMTMEGVGFWGKVL